VSFELNLLAPAGAHVRLPEVRQYLSLQPLDGRAANLVKAAGGTPIE
jgi:hypothetical protein